MAGGAALLFVLVEGHDEHVVAGDADAMDERAGWRIRFRFGVVFGLGLWCVVHKRILA